MTGAGGGPVHSLAALVAHSHDAHAEHHHHDHGDEGTHHAAMLAVPGHACEFDDDRHRLALLYRALTGREGDLIAHDEPGDAAGPSDTLFLPAHAPIDEHHGLTRSAWYRVAVTHRALHHLLGTFTLDIDRDEPLYTRLRPPRRGSDATGPFERLGAMFARPRLAIELFVALEDLRIDAAARRLLPGLAESFRLACHHALHDRPALAMLPAREAVVEALVQFGLGAEGVLAPAALDAALGTTIATARLLLDPRASVESTVEATIRVYDVVAAIAPRAAYRSVRAVAFAEFDGAVTTARKPPAAGDGPDVTFHPVPFRDAAGTRHVSGDPGSDLPLDQAVLRMALSEDPRAVDPRPDDPADPGTQPAGSPRPGETTDPGAASEPDYPAGVTALVPRPGDGPVDRSPDGGRLWPSGPGEYVYDEWDTVAGRYLPDRCLVRVTRAPATDGRRWYRRALQRHGRLLPQLVAALERVEPAGRDLALRQPYGDDLDLDACVEAMTDLRAGLEPSDRVFASLRPGRRDVAVAIGVDLSGSTAEALPPDPGEPRIVRSTLDLQRDAVTLLAEALDRVGDGYGIYGFSGSGRADVRLSVVKDLDERRGPAMVRRLDGLRPDHTTRMGAAIRHLTARLARVDAATRVLLVVSDGRPFDIDYGQQYGEYATVGYALADTGRALAEARAAGAFPYLVTVDAGGADYLSEICDPREYHVIADARELPRSLGELYAVARSEALRAGRRQALVAPASSAANSGASSR